MEEIEEVFKVKFNHLISPDISLIYSEPDKVNIEGQVKIAIDLMLKDFTSGLGLKSVMDKLVKKTVNNEGYFLDIHGIAEASIAVINNRLNVRAEYRASKEWWAKPIALIVLGKLLNDFASKVEDCGIIPGFRINIKKAMQDLRKNNSAILDLKALFEDQVYFTESSKIYLKEFCFEKVNTFSDNGNFIIEFSGKSKSERVKKNQQK